MTTLAVLDLDNTLIYSSRALARWDDSISTDGYVCVDRIGERGVAFASPTTIALLGELDRSAVIVPASARSKAQFERLALFRTPPAIAILANGAEVVRDGQPDRDWEARIAERVAASAAVSDAVQDRLGRERWVARHPYLLVAVGSDEAAAVDLEVRTNVDLAGMEWIAHADGRRVYVHPMVVSKAAAATYVADLIGPSQTIAAGDSVLDRDLLDWAEVAIIPAHGALSSEPIGSSDALITVGRGTAASEEICGWLLASAKLHNSS